MTKPGFKTSRSIHLLSQILINELRPDRLLPNLIAGLVVGILVIIFSISLASLVFAGELSSFTPIGIALTLFGAMVIGIVVTLFSSFPETIAAPQEVPAAILALIVTSIIKTMPEGATLEETIITVVFAIASTSILTGLLFLALGYFKLGNLVRFLPYPVIGGFLAGTGWLLIIGAITVVTDVSLEFSTLSVFLRSDILLRWLPALFFAILILITLNHYRHFLVMPTMILGAVGLFYFIMWITNTSIAELNAQGWLFKPPNQRLSPSIGFSDLTKVNWFVVVGQIGNMATLLVISVVALLLNATGLELVVRQDINLNRELKIVGIGNIIGGFLGGLVGFHLLSETTLSYKIGGRGRLVGLVVVILCGFVLLWGKPILYYFPKLLLGSMLMMLGLSFLIEWIYKAWFRLSRIDYCIIITILVVIAVFGFLQGVTTGIVLTVLFFVINYSRINVVKHSYSSANYQSRVYRRRAHRKILIHKGDEIQILQLQGFIFFGTANNLLALVRRQIVETKKSKVRFIILDFGQVTGLDLTAMLSFKKIIHLAKIHQVILVFTNPPNENIVLNQSYAIDKFFTQLGNVEKSETKKTIRIFPDLDYGMEWCENQILISAGVNPNDDKESLHFLFRSLFPDATNLDSLLKYFEKLEVGSGHYLMKEGDPPGDLFFIESGKVTVQLEFPDRSPFRLGTLGVGGIVGEIGFFLNQPRTAAVVTKEPCTIQRLSWQTLKKMEKHDPDLAYLFHQSITLLLAERLTILTNSINSLQP